MNRHLSSEEFSGWVLGERSPEAERHVESCPACHSELARVEGALTHFRSAVHQWSAEGPATGFQPAHIGKGASWLSVNKLSWACAVVVACLLVSISVPLPWHQKPAAETSLADAKLLSQIDSALSRSVPSPMEPLTKLVAWDGSSSRENKKTDEKNEQ